MANKTAKTIAQLTQLIELYEREELMELSEAILDKFRKVNDLSRDDVGYKTAKKIEKYLRKYHSQVKRGNHAKAGKYLDRIKKLTKKMK